MARICIPDHEYKERVQRAAAILQREGLDAGRRQVAMLVGRDTEKLTEEQKEALRRFDDAMNGIASETDDDKKKKKGFFSKFTD